MERRKSIPADGVAAPSVVVGATVFLPFSTANKAEAIIVVVIKTATKTASHRL